MAPSKKEELQQKAGHFTYEGDCTIRREPKRSRTLQNKGKDLRKEIWVLGFGFSERRE